MTNLCSPSTMCGPFCSVPAVPTMTVVVPALIRSRTSAHVNSSSHTVSGGLPEGEVAGALAGRWAAAKNGDTRIATHTSSRTRLVMTGNYSEGDGRTGESVGWVGWVDWVRYAG